MNIDTFVNIPILVASGLGVILIALMITAKLRNTAKVSFIFYIATAIGVAGLVYTYFSRRLMYLVLAVALSELVLFVYTLVLAVADPVKLAEKKAKKEGEKDDEMDEATKLALAKQAEKHTEIINTENEMIAKASSFFSAEDAMGAFLQYLSKLMIERTKSDGCVILMYDEADDILAVKSVEGKFPPPYKLPDDLPHKPIRIETNFKFSQFATSGNVFGDIFSGAKAVNVTNPAKDPKIFQNGPEDFLKCGPYLFIPMLQDGEPVALICLSRAFGQEIYEAYEVTDATRLVESAATAIKPLNSFLSFTEHAEATKEGDIATKFQKALLPEKLPVINKLSIGKFEVPAENVCGDYYDIIPSRKERISFIMGDVAGKGMTSLVMMAMIRAMLRLISNTDQSSATLLNWVNKAICSEKNSMDHFASISLINYNSIDNTAQIATSGTNPVLLYTAADSSIKKISVDCEPIGVEKTTEYKDVDLTLNAGDILVICTDGVLECLNENGVQYSLDSLKKVVNDNAKLDGKGIANKVKDSVKKFCGTTQQYDDQSLLVIKIQG